MSLRFPKDIQQQIADKISDIYSTVESYSIASIIIETLFKISSTQLIINDSLDISDNQSNEIENICDRLKKHEPIQYILKNAPFYGLDFYVKPGVLIPRQETESLIELITNYKTWENPTVLDIGTGSGCIACSLYKNLVNATVQALDVSHDAIKVAQKNATDLQCNIEFHQINILDEELSIQKIDIIVSNPPYVMNNEKVQMHNNVLNHEPHLALFVSNDDPLVFYRTITKKSQRHLTNQGVLFFEINEQFGSEVALLMEQHQFKNVQIHNDINDKNRFVSGEWHS